MLAIFGNSVLFLQLLCKLKVVQIKKLKEIQSFILAGLSSNLQFEFWSTAWASHPFWTGILVEHGLLMMMEHLLTSHWPRHITSKSKINSYKSLLYHFNLLLQCKRCLHGKGCEYTQGKGKKTCDNNAIYHRFFPYSPWGKKECYLGLGL